MTRAGSRILQGAREAMAIAKGEADRRLMSFMFQKQSM